MRRFYKYKRFNIKYKCKSNIILSCFFVCILGLSLYLFTTKDNINTDAAYNKSIEEFVLEKDKIIYDTSKIYSKVEKKQYTPEAIDIMGYKLFDIKQAQSWILSSFGNNIKNMTSMIDLNGLTLEEHLENLNEVSKLEDVDPNLVLAQQVRETGYFTFRKNMNGDYSLGSVLPSYYNFAGLGAVDNKTMPPEKFGSNIEGQLAQVQHLKGYATIGDMNTEVVDTRLKYIGDNRGSVTTAADLSNKWASDKTYGDSLADLYTSLVNHNINLNLIQEYCNKIYGPLPQNSK